MEELIIETSQDGRFRVRLVVDTNPVNPRKDRENLAHVITPTQSRYLPVDEDGGPLQHGWDHFSMRPDSEALFTRWARIYHGAAVVEHRPAQGAWSLWYLTADDVADAGIPDPEACIREEIAEYQAWADGEVFGYVIEKAVQWGRRDGQEGSMTTWDHVDSLWGLVGYEYAEQAAKEEFESFLNSKES